MNRNPPLILKLPYNEAFFGIRVGKILENTCWEDLKAIEKLPRVVIAWTNSITLGQFLIRSKLK